MHLTLKQKSFFFVAVSVLVLLAANIGQRMNTAKYPTKIWASVKNANAQRNIFILTMVVAFYAINLFPKNAGMIGAKQRVLLHQEFAQNAGKRKMKNASM